MRSLSVEEERKKDRQNESCHGDCGTGMALRSCPLLERRGWASIFSFGQAIGIWADLMKSA